MACRQCRSSVAPKDHKPARGCGFWWARASGQGEFHRVGRFTAGVKNEMDSPFVKFRGIPGWKTADRVDIRIEPDAELAFHTLYYDLDYTQYYGRVIER